MGSTIIPIPDEEGTVAAVKERKKFQFSDLLSYLREKKTKHDMRKLTHSIKVGIALVLVSLFYLVYPLYEQVRENAMWAIMTVVVMFEFYAGATFRKGLNRGIGTILGGVMGCLAAALAQQVGGIGNAILVGASVFIFGAAATYSRTIPNIKKKYDYGAMIFILTFNLVVVSGIYDEEVMKLARERLLAIGMGFAVCIFISLLIFPIWASDELHDSIASKFKDLSSSIEGSLEEYFRFASEKDNQQPSANSSSCKSTLNSKSKDELLANFAKWEPWHGKFGIHYPWGKYLQIGERLRELAATIRSLESCLQSPRQPSTTIRQSIEEPCKAAGSSLASAIKELGECILKMRRCQTGDSIVPKLKETRLGLSLVMSSPNLGQIESADGLAIASFVFLLMEMVEKVEDMAKEVEELGELAGFRT